MTMRRIALTALMMLAATPVLAADRRLTIVNATANTVVRLHAAAAGSGEWADDLLGDRVLKPGQSVQADIGDGSGGCLFDLRAETDDGRQQVRAKVNVCELTTYRFGG